MAGLPDQRECHPDHRPHAQPRVTAIVHPQLRDGGRAVTGSGTDNGHRVTRTAHSTHRQAVIPAPPGSRAAYLLVSADDTRRHGVAKRPAALDRAW
jgi:hypothetical protein